MLGCSSDLPKEEPACFPGAASFLVLQSPAERAEGSDQTFHFGDEEATAPDRLKNTLNVQSGNAGRQPEVQAMALVTPYQLRDSGWHPESHQAQFHW